MTPGKNLLCAEIEILILSFNFKFHLSVFTKKSTIFNRNSYPVPLEALASLVATLAQQEIKILNTLF